MISSALLALSVALLAAFVANINGIFAERDRSVAFEAALSGIEDAKIRVIRDNGTTDCPPLAPCTLQLADGTATYTLTVQSGVATIDSTGLSKTTRRRVIVTFDLASNTQTSWREAQP